MATQSKRTVRSVADVFSDGVWSGKITLATGYKVAVTGRIADSPTVDDLATLIGNGTQKTDKAGLMPVKAPGTESAPVDGVSLPIARSVRATPDQVIEALYSSVGLPVPESEPIPAAVAARLQREAADKPIPANGAKA